MTNPGGKKSRQSKFERWKLILFCLLCSALWACNGQRRKSDADLALKPQQAAGRRVYDDQCARCHEAYSSSDKNGPALQGLFKHPYMRSSGLPAKDERVQEIILYGRANMPGFAPVLSQQQVNDLLAYLHTL